MGWNYLISIPKLHRYHCYLSMLGLKLIHVSKRGHRNPLMTVSITIPKQCISKPCVLDQIDGLVQETYDSSALAILLCVFLALTHRNIFQFKNNLTEVWRPKNKSYFGQLGTYSMSYSAHIYTQVRWCTKHAHGKFERDPLKKGTIKCMSLYENQKSCCTI